MDRPLRSRAWLLAAAAILSVAVFLALTLPSVPAGPVIGTGQDEWYNMIRSLRALYEDFNPSYFIHPALFYESLASLYGFQRIELGVTGHFSDGSGYLDYVLAHESQCLALARYASVAGGALAVLAAVWLGAVLAGGGAALLSGLLIGSLPLLQTMATSIRVDALALAAWLAGAALIVRRNRRPNRSSLGLAAVGIGVAAAANYPGALLLLPLGWLEWSRAGTERLSQRALAFAAAGGLAGAVFLALNPYVLIDLPDFLRWFSFQANVALATHPHADAPSAVRYLELLREQGPAAVVACVAGIAAIVGQRQETGALAGFGLFYLAAFSAMRSQYDRFALPAIALLCVAGTSWLCTEVTRRAGRRAATAVVAAAALLIVYAAIATIHPAMSSAEAPGVDYRAEMFDWIAAHVPPTATLVFESDTLPLLQEAYDPGDRGSRFQIALREAFERVHPHLPKRIIKAQFIAAVYNYDPKLLDDGPVFFLASSQNRDYIGENRAALAEPAAFYDALDARATVVHEIPGVHENLILYRTGAR
jgi:hypothetical protein